MRRTIIAIVLALIAAGIIGYFKREPIILSAMAARAEKQTLADREALLTPAMQFFEPANAVPPYPAVLQFHGCAGIRQPFMEQWAKVANDAGYLAVVVDSFGPRGWDRAEALDIVCGGNAMIGQERAGDMLAAFDIVRKLSDVDPDRIVLAGWSHGAWSLMDLIALDPPRRAPAGIVKKDLPNIDPAGLILVYPYCGLGAWTRLIGWRAPPKTLAFIAGEDTVVDSSLCVKVFDKLHEKHANVNTQFYPHADHVFDDPYLEPEYQKMYDAGAHSDETARYRAFLDEIARR